jgi:hypothetical protein
MPMTGIYRVQILGIPLPIWRTEDKQEEILIGSVEELYNEMKIDCCWFPKKSFQRF